MCARRVLKNKLQDLLVRTVLSVLVEFCSEYAVPASLHGNMEEVSVALRVYQQLSLVSPTWSVCVRKIMHRKRVYVRARVCRVCLHSYS